jgi:hypothetical protein
MEYMAVLEYTGLEPWSTDVLLALQIHRMHEQWGHGYFYHISKDAAESLGLRQRTAIGAGPL